ncbi:ATP phosphoribosyltransferase regulatory subunit [Deinococcus pimensis]|uniref:ATP phosphoribosyltransferase regulatory subunit n=1 Tax=Deinococcus pimensis TaxID=309888 RepID=UPI00048914BB|nr:ATP phosphoribosyltransferase regulatory subunit [Deinococcus pimensis]
MIIPVGTRDVLPHEWAWRQRLIQELQAFFTSWGYQGVGVPALEYQNHAHPQDARAFKLIDRDGSVLALRSEFTTAVGRLVRARFPDVSYPLRLQYAGALWLRQQTSEPGRLREFTQLGVELVGVSNARADAELLEVAAGALRTVGLDPQLELGHPRFVDAVLEDVVVDEGRRRAMHAAVDSKAAAEIRDALGEDAPDGVLATLEALPELYGGAEVLDEARALDLGPRARAALDRLSEIAALYGGELLFDLGMSRRYEYYTGFTFRAYQAGFPNPILGGGRYDAGIPGAGFALGLEQLTTALGSPPEPGELVLALTVEDAWRAHAAGLRAELAWTDDARELAAYARTRGILRVARGGGFEDVEVLA